MTDDTLKAQHVAWAKVAAIDVAAINQPDKLAEWIVRLQYRLLRLGFAARKVLANPHTDETLICFVELKEAADAAFEEKP